MKARLLGHLSGIDENLERIEGDEPRLIQGRKGEGMWLICEVTRPPSAAGRPADVHIPANLIPGLFKALREQMIKDRAIPEAAGSFAHKVVEGLAGR